MIHLPESHSFDRIGWLRAAVMGANDGIVSTASLIVGVATAGSNHHEIIVSGVAGLVAGAMSMAAGEYISVSSQADAEKADLAREARELSENPVFEQQELAQIYITRGLEPTLADEVAKQLMAHDALGTHARDELGLNHATLARPVQAALVSAGTFSVGAGIPLLLAYLSNRDILVYIVSIISLISLLGLGVISAKIGRANVLIGAVRVAFWSTLAMVLTALIGWVFGSV